MTISVAIVSYNTREHLAACLATVVAERPSQIIVVDNGSDDGSPEMVRSEFSQVVLIPAPNEGYGAASNLALGHARTPYVLLLNSDTRLHPGALAALAEYLDVHPRVGMVGPQLVNPDGSLQPSVYPIPTPVAELMRWTSVAAIAAHSPRLRDRYLLRWPHDRSAPVGWVAGAALAIRKAAFDAVGGFDTSFFMYSEEVDLAYCLQKAGWEVHFAPHRSSYPLWRRQHGGRPGRDDGRLMFASMHRFYAKHYPPAWQRQLKVIITYLMLRNLVRDRWRLLRNSCPTAGEQLAQDLAAWRRVLRLTWSG